MKVGFIQFEPIFGEIDSNIDRVQKLIAETDAELLVLPELFNTGYAFQSREETFGLAEEIPSGRTTKALLEVARQKSIHIVAGICEKEGGRIFNSAILAGPDGCLGVYRKIHLFNEEKLWFQPGDGGFRVFDIGSCRVGLMICFDWFFPEAARILALKGAQVICHSANLVLPFCQQGMTTRCLENRVFAVTSNRTGREARGGRDFLFTGKSQITGPDGKILYQAAGDEQETGVVDIDVSAADDKNINGYNNLFNDRQTAYYGDLLMPAGVSPLPTRCRH